MSTHWESSLDRWTAAGLIDAATATRIRDWEGESAQSAGLRWPIWVALALGAILLGAGILLFVSAHWDTLSPSGRMAVVVALVGVFHAAGAAVTARFEGLAIALHTIGTVALGAGIALAGQIFHLSEHWPSAILLWAIGAALAWAILGHWTQGALTAILIPYWLAGEWILRTRLEVDRVAPIAVGICALCFAYLSARRSPLDHPLRKALGWIGGIALLPAAALVPLFGWKHSPAFGQHWAAWTIAVLAPAGVAVCLRGRDSLWACGGIAWAMALILLSPGDWHGLFIYFWCALGAAGLTFWGIREARAERINLGLAGFAFTVLGFYFSSVMDKLGRSASLTVLGLLFLGGGWLLERTRRQLLSQIRQEAL